MSETIISKILALKSLTVAELQKLYSQLYDVNEVDIRNKAYLWRKVAYRLQEEEELESVTVQILGRDDLDWYNDYHKNFG